MSRNLFLSDAVAAWTCIEVEGLHVDQVNYTLKLIFKTDWDFHHDSVKAKLLNKLVLYLIWVCTCSVALVYESDTWNVVSLHLAVNCD